MFDCGITKTMRELSTQVIRDEENTIVRVVNEIGYDIDKAQLAKVLTESRAFYDQGFKEGYNKGYKEALIDVYNDLIDNYKDHIGGDIREDAEEV